MTGTSRTWNITAVGKTNQRYGNHENHFRERNRYELIETHQYVAGGNLH